MRLFFKKIFSKKVLAGVFCVVSILFLAFMPIFVFNKENYSRDINRYLANSNGEKIVLDVWHVETFEGGTKSRKRYLEEVSKKFKKYNANIFVSVLTLTKEQLVLNLQNGVSPDLFSFSVGCGEDVLSYLKELDKNENIREDLRELGKMGKNYYAYPYMMSCYVAISKENGVDKSLSDRLSENVEKNKLNFGFAIDSNINISRALTSAGISEVNDKGFYKVSTTYEAYCGFVGNKFNTLIGTMRDMHRCKNRENLGSLGACKYEVLRGYNDLIQFMGINKGLSKNKFDIAKEFLDFVVCEKGQSLLNSYGLFSTTKLSLYDTSYMSEVESEINNCEFESINVFLKQKEIENKKEESMRVLFKNF